MRSGAERSVPTCAFSVRLEKELYDALYEYSFKSGESKNKILNTALGEFLKHQSSK